MALNQMSVKFAMASHQKKVIKFYFAMAVTGAFIKLAITS